MQQFNAYHDAGVSWSKMAIFYRINAMSRVMEDALRRAALPYEIARGVEFYGRKEIKDVLAYLRVIANPRDEVSLQRVINTPARGIGDNSVNLLQAHAVANGITLLEAMQRAGGVTGISKKAANSAMNLARLISHWRQLAGIQPSAQLVSELDMSVQSIIESVVKESGLEEYYAKESEDDAEGGPLANIEELINSAAEFDEENPQANLEAYLHQVSLVSDADHRGREGAITLMTLHAAKGLEFPVVAIIGMEEGILPHERVKDDAKQLEEERRLCFVGITRAQNQLLLSRVKDRSFRGMRNRQAASPFLMEMPQEQLEVIESPALGGESDLPYGERDRDEDDSYAEPKVKRGQRVQHPAFGPGVIADVSGMGGSTRVVVDFQRAGRKTLILEYARLSIIG